jgi:protoporphyrinogen oxidase
MSNAVLGAGMTGLSASISSGWPIFESADAPGGICSSYYMRSADPQRLPNAPTDGEAYRFEIGGGHWIFGGDPAVLQFIRTIAHLRTYERQSSIYFCRENRYVPYPLQNHLRYLPKHVAVRSLTEMAAPPCNVPTTLAEWLEQTFGKTLVDLFFGPFHEAYTAGLWTRIAPQDNYKSPSNFVLAVQGALGTAPPTGYNVAFHYPVDGLNTLAHRLASKGKIHYGKTIVKIDTQKKEVFFADGMTMKYDTLISTLPLSRMAQFAGVEVDAQPDPYTSVLVLNIGGTRGKTCPSDHWLYCPDSASGFYRVGFYSNVDSSFIPISARKHVERVSIYVERAYLGGQHPTEQEQQAYSQQVFQELQYYGFIDDVEALDLTWIDVAYTWTWPGSRWRSLVLKHLEENGIYQVGRYGRWIFQGIADSIRDGLMVGSCLSLTK